MLSEARSLERLGRPEPMVWAYCVKSPLDGLIQDRIIFAALERSALLAIAWKKYKGGTLCPRSMEACAS